MDEEDMTKLVKGLRAWAHFAITIGSSFVVEETEQSSDGLPRTISITLPFTRPDGDPLMLFAETVDGSDEVVLTDRGTTLENMDEPSKSTREKIIRTCLFWGFELIDGCIVRKPTRKNDVSTDLFSFCQAAIEIGCIMET